MSMGSLLEDVAELDVRDDEVTGNCDVGRAEGVNRGEGFHLPLSG